MMVKKKCSLQLVDVLKAANTYYDDGFLENYFNPKTGKIKTGRHGDTLAEFIVREIKDTFDADASCEDQINEAVRVMEGAQEDVNNTIRGLIELERKRAR
jgi:hypothetical protein